MYGRRANGQRAAQRLENLEKEHLELFKVPSEALFSTSGRTELGGNHTDHNLGQVLAGSINLDTIASVHRTDDLVVHLSSEGYKDLTVDLSDLEIKKSEYETTTSLIRGVAASIVKRGGKIGGFCANVKSSVFKGSGLSSSAAIEVLLGTIFNSLFNEDKFSTTELAIIGQEAENNYFGKPSGLMDQLACANGGIIGIDFKDPKNPVITPINIDFSDYGYDLVITTTGGNHADLTSDYASIPNEMRQVASYFGKTVLREVDPELFEKEIGNVRKALENDRAVLRAIHFFEENRRVNAMIQALKNKDIKTYFNLVNESGRSSFNYLQNIFSPANPHEQGIALALAMTEKFLGSSGAFRVQGGGFAGTIEAYIPCDRTKDYYSYMAQAFGPDCCTTLAIRNLSTMRVK